ncbi:MAG: GNAT family N-acetyltransferase [Anaerolineae bacterium]
MTSPLSSPPKILPASQFSLQTLTEAYNQTRIDYIVPMPMNVARLKAYIHHYDVDLDASAVAVLDDGEILGLAMLGVRGDRTWITRLGVLPHERRHGTGETLMRYLIAQAHQRGARQVSLEVIKDNWPAFYLFKKLGFVFTRELLVLRRPPRTMKQPTSAYQLELLSPETIETLLTRRRSQPSWLDETPSLRNAGQLEALRVTLTENAETGQEEGHGWIVFRHDLYQLSHLVIQAEAGDPERVVRALLHALHTHHPYHDTKFENLPAKSPYWPALKACGYLIAFRRLEMRLDLDKL